jgi:hypothetical protein
MGYIIGVLGKWLHGYKAAKTPHSFLISMAYPVAEGVD